MTLENGCGSCSLKIDICTLIVLTVIHAVLYTVIIAGIQLTAPLYYGQTYLFGPFLIIQYAAVFSFLYGAQKGKKQFILPILIVQLIEMMILSVYISYAAAVIHPTFVLLFVVVVLAFYLWYLKFSFYKHLSERDARANIDRNNLVEGV